MAQYPKIESCGSVASNKGPYTAKNTLRVLEIPDSGRKKVQPQPQPERRQFTARCSISGFCIYIYIYIRICIYTTQTMFFVGFDYKAQYRNCRKPTEKMVLVVNGTVI